MGDNIRYSLINRGKLFCKKVFPYNPFQKTLNYGAVSLSLVSLNSLKFLRGSKGNFFQKVPLGNQKKINHNLFKLIIAGGGTGGHIFPGISIINAVREICDVEVLWIGTGKPIEREILEKRDWQYRVLDVKPIMGMGYFGAFRSLLSIPSNILSAIKMILDFKPDIVVGVGGYVAGPVILASKLLGKKTAIHEQNLKPGLSNRICAKFCDVIWTSFEDTTDFFPNKKVIHTGNPVRQDIINIQDRDIQVNKDGFTILVFGGSQGASALNRISSNAFNLLKKSGINLNIIHQTGKNDKEEIEKFYLSNNLKAKVFDFIKDMGVAYEQADLVICRAGATTISELTAIGKPSILIPFPHSTGGHQEENARKLSEKGAALFFRQEDISPEKLAKVIEELINSPKRLEEMAISAKKMGKPDAARLIAKNITEICGVSSIKFNELFSMV